VTGRFPVTPVESGRPVALASVIVGPLESTTAPEPVAVVIEVPLMRNVFDAVSNVLFERVSVVARATSVSVAEGTVRVPEATFAGVRTVEPEELPARARFACVTPGEPTVTVTPEIVRMPEPLRVFPEEA
jgi:hypothetical protein